MNRRDIFALTTALLLCWGGYAYGQAVVATGQVSVTTGKVTINSPPNDVSAGPQNFTGAGTLAVNSQGSGSVGLVVTGSFSGAAWTLQGTVNGTTWTNIPFFDNTNSGNVYVAQPSATTTGTYIAPAAGYQQVRINVTAVTGTLTASLNASAGSAQRPVGVQGDNSNISGVNGNPVGDACFLQAKSNIGIGNTASTAEVIAGAANKKIYICSVSVILGSAAHLNFIEGTGSGCVTSNEAAIFGSTTAAAGMSLAANGGFTIGDGNGTVGVTATAGNNVCILLDASTQYGGNLTYVIQ